MSTTKEQTVSKKAPLYASPWLAFFHLLRHGLDQFRS